jgi:hypothetical protein
MTMPSASGGNGGNGIRRTDAIGSVLQNWIAARSQAQMIRSSCRWGGAAIQAVISLSSAELSFSKASR